MSSSDGAPDSKKPRPESSSNGSKDQNGTATGAGGDSPDKVALITGITGQVCKRWISHDVFRGIPPSPYADVYNYSSPLP